MAWSGCIENGRLDGGVELSPPRVRIHGDTLESPFRLGEVQPPGSAACAEAPRRLQRFLAFSPAMRPDPPAAA